jgi:dynein light chain roadblock-type
MSSEVEETLKRIQSHKGVKGVLIMNAEVGQFTCLRWLFIAKATKRSLLSTPLFYSVHSPSPTYRSQGISIKSSLSPEDTEHYAALVSQLAFKASGVVRTLDDTDELAFLRIRYYYYLRFDVLNLRKSLLSSFSYAFRSKKHEIMIAPDKDYILVVIQNPHEV